ncbi:MAG: tyrosine-type recombinase/integrase [Acidimicrobiia bacterium]|jgi:site-specific recombinase XerD|nr:tyrosine-type recombinase/integrase [Acidimicrobiia bacterium]MBP8181319.1 tyrosine-type recombinase/integrase [Acidimicrobiia bacterium]
MADMVKAHEESLEPSATKWLDRKDLAKPSPNTKEARRRDLTIVARHLADEAGRPHPFWLEPTAKGFERELGRVTISDLNNDQLASAFAKFARTHAASSIRRARSTWRGFCQWLVTDDETLAFNPIDKLEGPRKTPWQPKPISEEDLVRLIEAAQRPDPSARSPWPELERAICATFVGAGLRVSEVANLQVGNLHRSITGIDSLHVTGKGNKTRTIPFPPEAVEAVTAYLESRRDKLGSGRPNEPMFVRPNGEPLTRRVLDHMVSGWFRRAGLVAPPGALNHSLRHSYATLLVEQTGSLPEVQRLLGHADLATTQAYVGVSTAGVAQTAMANPAREFLKRASRAADPS